MAEGFLELKIEHLESELAKLNKCINIEYLIVLIFWCIMIVTTIFLAYSILSALWYITIILCYLLITWFITLIIWEPFDKYGIHIVRWQQNKIKKVKAELEYKIQFYKNYSNRL